MKYFLAWSLFNDTKITKTGLPSPPISEFILTIAMWHVCGKFIGLLLKVAAIPSKPIEHVDGGK